jgi:hypothetical protein
MMTAQAWVAMSVGIMAILSGLYGMTRFIVKSIMAEIGPKANGSSIKEQVNRIEARLDYLYNLLMSNELKK